MNDIMDNVDVQRVALSQVKLDDSDLENERLRAQRTDAFTHRIEFLRSQLNHTHDAAKNRMVSNEQLCHLYLVMNFVKFCPSFRLIDLVKNAAEIFIY